MPPSKRRKTTKTARTAKTAKAAKATDNELAPEPQDELQTESSGVQENSVETADNDPHPEPQDEQQIEPSAAQETPIEIENHQESEPAPSATDVKAPNNDDAPAPAPAPEPEPSTSTATSTSASASTSTPTSTSISSQDRMARFRALQARAKTGADQNLKEATKESARLATNPQQLVALNRKHAVASHKLLKADIEESGGDFERKRAWDWTVDESERWDRRVRKKDAHRDDSVFRDFTHAAQQSYKRLVRKINPDQERYNTEKLAAIEKAAAAGTLEIIETEDGEMIAVDKDGSFLGSTATPATSLFDQSKPSKDAIDRLVMDHKKAEEASLKKKRERMAENGTEEDVTYINEKNKHFNLKLARFYNKYTAEIKESFERGTAL